MCLGWMLSVAMIVRAVVREKESRIKEVMQMMGLGRGQLWGAWFLTSFLTLLISVVFITLALKVSTLPPLPPVSLLSPLSPSLCVPFPCHCSWFNNYMYMHMYYLHVFQLYSLVDS